MPLSVFQKTEAGINTLFFLILIGFLRPTVINSVIDAKFAIIFTILFFIWRILSLSLTNNYHFIKEFKNKNIKFKPIPNTEPDHKPDPEPDISQPNLEQCKDPYF